MSNLAGRIKKTTKRVDESFSKDSDHGKNYNAKVKVYINSKPVYLSREEALRHLYGSSGSYEIANHIIGEILSSVQLELRNRQIDKITKPYAVLYSLATSTKDMIWSPSYHDKRYDDGEYEVDEATVDPGVPEKDVWAVHEANPGER